VTIGAGLLATALSQGCGSGVGEAVDDRIGDQTESTGVVADPSALYANNTATWASPHIKVCWESNPTSADALSVRDAIHESWEIESNVIFEGWGQCTATSPGVHVRLHNGALTATALGKNLNGVVNGLSLPNWSTTSCLAGWTRERCMRASAVRGFGYALGFVDEQNRSDKPPSCTAAPTGLTGNTSVGAFDAQSVMSGCSTVPFNDGKLTARDIQGLQQFYGGPRSMAAVASQSDRLDIFVRGQDGAVWHKWYNGSWNGFISRGGSISGPPTTVSWGANRVDVFARGTDGVLKWGTLTNGTTWSGFTSVRSELQIMGTPKAVSWGANRIDVFVRAADGSPRHTFWNGSTWSTPAPLSTVSGGIPNGDIEAIARPPNKLDVFLHESSGFITHSSSTGSGWSNWSGVMPSESLPDAIVNSSSLITVFGRSDTHGITYASKTDPATVFGPWGAIAGSFSGNPSAVSRSATAADVLARGQDGYPYVSTWNGSTWGAWVLVDEFFMRGSPSLVSWNSTRLDLFIKANDDSMRQNFRIGGATAPWPAWFNAGGNFK
jgi:hypothetical protein